MVSGHLLELGRWSISGVLYISKKNVNMRTSAGTCNYALDCVKAGCYKCVFVASVCVRWSACLRPYAYNLLGFSGAGKEGRFERL